MEIWSQTQEWFSPTQKETHMSNMFYFSLLCLIYHYVSNILKGHVTSSWHLKKLVGYDLIFTVRWRARILRLLKDIIKSLFWVVDIFFLSTSWNLIFEYFLNSLNLEIDIWLFQLQSYYLFPSINIVCH